MVVLVESGLEIEGWFVAEVREVVLIGGGELREGIEIVNGVYLGFRDYFYLDLYFGYLFILFWFIMIFFSVGFIFLGVCFSVCFCYLLKVMVCFGV